MDRQERKIVIEELKRTKSTLVELIDYWEKVHKEKHAFWIKESQVLTSAIADLELLNKVAGGVELDILAPLGELGNRCYGEGKGEINTTIAIEVEKSEKKILDLCNAHWAGKLAGIEEVIKMFQENPIGDFGDKKEKQKIEREALAQAIITHLTAK